MECPEVILEEISNGAFFWWYFSNFDISPACQWSLQHLDLMEIIVSV